MRRYSFIFTLILAGSFLLTGCHHPFGQQYFRGHLSYNDLSGVSSQGMNTVQIRVVPQGRESALIEVRGKDGERLIEDIQIDQFKRRFPSVHRSFRLYVPLLGGNPVVMKRFGSHQGQHCYFSDQEYQIELCQRDESFSVKVLKDGFLKFSLFGAHCSNLREREEEDGEIFTVKQAIDRALKKDYGLLYNREIMIQAGLAARAAYLNLLPKIGFNSASSVVLGVVVEPPALLGALSDFVPFLFPGRWIQAEQAKWQYEAQKMAHVLARANLASSVHTLTLAYVWHQAYLDTLKNLRSQMKKAIPGLPALVRRGLVKPEDIENYEIRIDDLTLLIHTTQTEVEQMGSQLTSVLGFSNPEAVVGIHFDSAELSQDLENMPVFEDHALLLDEQRQRSHLALFQSPEIHQQCFLKRAVALGEKNLKVNWMDPSENGIGFSLGSQIKQVHSMVRAIDIQMRAIEQTLASMIYEKVDFRNHALLQFHVSQPSLLKRFKSLNKALVPIFEAIEDPSQTEPLDIPEVREVLEGFLEGLNFFFHTRAAAQVEQVVLDRLSFDGYYTQFLGAAHLPIEDLPNRHRGVDSTTYELPNELFSGELPIFNLNRLTPFDDHDEGKWSNRDEERLNSETLTSLSPRKKRSSKKKKATRRSIRKPAGSVQKESD